MTSEILLKISGLQMADQDSDTIETISPGTYYNRNGKHYFIYEDVTEGFEQPTENRIKLKQGYMELHKKGLTNVHMVFEKDKKNVTYYYTPYGSLLIGIDTTKVEVTETESTITAEIEYALEINNEFVADCHISIEASSDKKVDLS
ncbi:MAG: DUF1934 domain-containing protein [Lachnospiraceae bacterium]|nr:DUF1934 domain-containing protein [Lachnospiraceae bacterium]